MAQRRDVFTWKIGGVGGQGQQAAGAVFAKTCLRAGLQTVTYSEYPSIIRGGHGATQVCAASRTLTAPYRTVNLLVALNLETLQLHASELSHDAAIVYDSSKVTEGLEPFRRSPLHALPINELVAEAKVPAIASNVIAVGASFGLLGLGLPVLQHALRDQFAGKGEAVVAMNCKAAEAGYRYAQTHFRPDRFPYRLAVRSGGTAPPLLSGNEALSLGIVAAGCQLYVAYPMSPSSAILHNLAAWAFKTGMVVRQPEDEIAGVHVMIGANFTGTRAAVGTSGGGFALMNEAVTLAAMTETPAVLVVCSRPGPATGIPTWTEQGDLKYVVNCGHGDFPRAVLTPGDPQEAYDAAAVAFNAAEHYQLPAFILMDKFVCESVWAMPGFAAAKPHIDRGVLLHADDLENVKEYRRYQITGDGVSPRALPGTPGGIHLANSDEHDEFGFALESFGVGEQTRRQMMEKRMGKLHGVLAELPKPKLYGPKRAKLTLLGWGSTKGPVLEALRELPYVNYVHLPAVWPIPEHEIHQLVSHAEQLVTIENNFTGQFATILRGATGITPHHQLLKYNGSQFWPEELVEEVKALLS